LEKRNVNKGDDFLFILHNKLPCFCTTWVKEANIVYFILGSLVQIRSLLAFVSDPVTKSWHLGQK